MKSTYQNNAVDTAPDLSQLTSDGYPTNGNSSLGIPATQPGAAWFHSVTSEIVNAITTLGGTPSSEEVNQLANTLKTCVFPIGSYIQFAGSQAPEGFLVCNGGAVSRTTYAKLFAVIGTKYGSGDGSTTFNLPNLTDRFLQGSTTSGTVKNAGLPNITAYVDGCLGLSGLGLSGAFWLANISASNQANTSEKAYHGLGFTASRSNSIYGNSTTVQPPALTCLICIKY